MILKSVQDSTSIFACAADFYFYFIEFLIPMTKKIRSWQRKQFSRDEKKEIFCHFHNSHLLSKFNSSTNLCHFCQTHTQKKKLQWFCSFVVQFFDSWPIVLYIIYYCNSTLKLYVLLFLQYCHTIFCPKFIPHAIFPIHKIYFSFISSYGYFFMQLWCYWYFCNEMNLSDWLWKG